MARAPLGTQELQLLRHITRTGPQTVGQVAETFGAAQALARSTILTMMERLRGKRYLQRRRNSGVYVYTSPARDEDVLRDVVGGFVERSLEGSVSPFVAYLSRRSQVSDQELLELEALVDRLRARRRERAS